MRNTAKLLDLLELLQSRRTATGAEIAERLGVDRRTVRRYVAALQELGIPVEGERGVAGGYRLGSGFRLPPLMLGEREAAAVALGLAASRRLGLGDAAEAEAALGKLLRVLPPARGARVEALGDALAFTLAGSEPMGVATDRLLDLAHAVHRRRRLALTYQDAAGERSEREVSPYAVVLHAGRWYLTAFDHDRAALRTFRADRIERARATSTAAAAPPAGFDAASHVQATMARVPWRHEVEVLLELPVAEARKRLPPTLAELEPDGGHTRMVMRADELAFAARVLAGLGCPFTIVRPPALGEAVRALAEDLVTASRSASPGSRR